MSIEFKDIRLYGSTRKGTNIILREYPSDLDLVFWIHFEPEENLMEDEEKLKLIHEIFLKMIKTKLFPSKEIEVKKSNGKRNLQTLKQLIYPQRANKCRFCFCITFNKKCTKKHTFFYPKSKIAHKMEQ